MRRMRSPAKTTHNRMHYESDSDTSFATDGDATPGTRLPPAKLHAGAWASVRSDDYYGHDMKERARESKMRPKFCPEKQATRRGRDPNLSTWSDATDSDDDHSDTSLSSDLVARADGGPPPSKRRSGAPTAASAERDSRKKVGGKTPDEVYLRHLAISHVVHNLNCSPHCAPTNLNLDLSPSKVEEFVAEFAKDPTNLKDMLPRYHPLLMCNLFKLMAEAQKKSKSYDEFKKFINAVEEAVSNVSHMAPYLQGKTVTKTAAEKQHQKDNELYLSADGARFLNVLMAVKVAKTCSACNMPPAGTGVGCSSDTPVLNGCNIVKVSKMRRNRDGHFAPVMGNSEFPPFVLPVREAPKNVCLVYVFTRFPESVTRWTHNKRAAHMLQKAHDAGVRSVFVCVSVNDTQVEPVWWADDLNRFASGAKLKRPERQLLHHYFDTASEKTNELKEEWGAPFILVFPEPLRCAVVSLRE